MALEIGKAEKLDVREIWRREAADFTKWLANNVERLNEALDLDITVQTVEENVGPYRVDIYGYDGEGNTVIIENQLEKTNHGHLGQILTYLVNLDASIAIWITTNPVEEHRQVIEWLNEITPENMRFYLVKVEALRINGQGPAAPLFTLVEGPSQERKKIGTAKKDDAHRYAARKEFWTQFIEAMNQKSSLCQNISPKTDTWIAIALGMSGVSLNLVATHTDARAEIYINRGDKAENKKIFDHFVALKGQIEKEFGSPLVWERMDDRVTSRIKHQLDGVDIFSQSDWPKMNSFMIETAIKMHQAFKGPVQKLRS